MKINKLEKYILSLLSDGKVMSESDIWMDVNIGKSEEKGVPESDVFGAIDSEFNYPPEQVERAINSLESIGLIKVGRRPVRIEKAEVPFDVVDKDDSDVISYDQRWCWISNAGKSGSVNSDGEWISNVRMKNVESVHERQSGIAEGVKQQKKLNMPSTIEKEDISTSKLLKTKRLIGLRKKLIKMSEDYCENVCDDANDFYEMIIYESNIGQTGDGVISKYLRQITASGYNSEEISLVANSLIGRRKI